MQVAEAAELIRDGVGEGGGVWADLGAGSGTFTRALARLLGPQARIYAIDHDPAAIRTLARQAAAEQAENAPTQARIIPVAADFRELASLPALAGVRLDGVLLANALHFVADPVSLLSRIAGMLRPGGRLVVVEYDRRPASRWVPYPVSQERLRQILPAAGFVAPAVVGTRPSRYGGTIYAALARLPA